MTRKEANIYLAAILETLAEGENGEAPEGILYAGIATAGASFGDWQAITNILLAGLLCERTPGPCLKLTDKGRKAVERIAEARATA